MVQEMEIKKIDTDIQMQIGQRIQKLRMERALSGADVGAYLDISANQVSRIETGKAKCSLEHIFILSQLLDCSADFLLFGKKDTQRFSQEQVACIWALVKSFS